MSTNYAEKYSATVDERFSQQSLTENAFNRDFDFTGVNTISLYSVPTAAMNDYRLDGINRYGTPDELGDSVQTLTLSQDRAFTFTIDRRNYADTMMVKEAGRALGRQLTEVVLPEVDKYRLNKLAAGAGTVSAPEAITAGNAYDSFLAGVTTLLNNNTPLSGTFAFIGTNFYRYIRQDKAFIQASDTAQTMLLHGQVGSIESIPLIFVPTSYMPDDTEFIIMNRSAAWAAQKLAEYKVHDNPPGINGWLVEGRIYHDAGVLVNKNKSIYLHTFA